MTGSTCFIAEPMSSHTFHDESATFQRSSKGVGNQDKRRSLGPGPSESTSSLGSSAGRGKITKRKTASLSGSSKSSPSPDPEAASSHMPTLRFVTTTDPTQFKDRSTMRGNRSHVMYNHLKQRQQRSPSASPSEAPRSAKSGKAKETRPKHERSPSGYSDTLEVPSSGDSYAGFLPEEPHSGHASQPHSPQSFVLSPLSENFVEDWNPSAFDPPTSAHYYSASFPTMGPLVDYQPLVPPRRLSSTHNLVDLAFQNYAPFKPMADSPIEPFRSLPGVDPELMKYHYNSLFGTNGMEGAWIPTLVGTRVAFMSSICFAAVHLDAISSSPSESYEAAAARLEVMHMINESMGNPAHVASNPIIVAALHLTFAELVNMEDGIASSHCGGIERMISIRGGSHKLGMDGQLAGMATTASFLTSILGETRPSPMHVSYFNHLRRHSGSPVNPAPESPLFCPRADFSTLVRARECGRHTFELLSDLRDLTDLFVAAERRASDGRRFQQQSSFEEGTDYENAHERNTMQRLRIASRILGLPSAADPNVAGQPCYGDWTYEACRLAALVYVHALTSHTPLSASSGAAAAASASASGEVLLLALRDALVRSDVSACWGDMAGVLLWVTLVGAVAARGVHGPDLLATRRWMRALAVRCTLLLAFEHRVPLLGSLRTMLDVIGFCSATTAAHSGATSASEDDISVAASRSVEHLGLDAGY